MTKLVTASANTELDILLEIVCLKLQLTKSQHEDAEDKYGAITRWLLADGSAIRDHRPDIYPQGSLGLGTTAKPYLRNEFDLDLVCQLWLPAWYHPGRVYQMIWNRMAENGTYAPMMRRCRRCIRLEYANDFHLDIVPAVPDSEENGDHILVPDLHADLEPEHPTNNRWKPSNPRGYKGWFRGKCIWRVKESYQASAEPLPAAEPIHKKPALKRAVQLFKRWRDKEFHGRKDLEPPSIILTTLAGHFYRGEVLCTDALTTILHQIVMMRARGEIICKTNPANEKERICERWEENPKSLEAFDDAIKKFYASWLRLLKMTGIAEITAELKRLFGEMPIDAAVKEFAEQQLNRPRQDGQLLMEKSTGRMRTATAHPAVVAALASTMPVPRNRFHGE
ncbi:MAG: nucleotidyltransferase [Planctomycetaceae bacterium]|nr:nucleotidyltransferase [Planctomycetaceae bacterium]